MSTRLPKVCIIGIGPSGLAAAHAVAMWDGRPRLASKDLKPSGLFGCQYLHAPIPISSLSATVTVEVDYKLVGTEAGYRRKVYGEGYQGPVSVERYAGKHSAWDLRQTYSELWSTYVAEAGEAPFPFMVTPDRLSGYADRLREDFDMVVSTVPAHSLCVRPDQHSFNSQTIYASGDAPELGVEVPVHVDDNTIVCNGNPEPHWYRASRVFGHATIEWAGERKPPYEGVKAVDKPVWTDCDCFPWIHRLGRFGSWRKSVLVHDVFEQATILMKTWHGYSLITKRKDWCYRCGFIAVSERLLIEPKGATEYRCLNGHVWDDHNGSKSASQSG